MERITQLRKFFTILLLAVVLFVSTAISPVAQSALADKSREANDVSNFKGDSSAVNQSYHNLQSAAHDFRQNFREEITTGQRSPSKNRNNSPKQAAKNVGKNTRNAFERAADSVKETLDPG
ncbi:MAG: hypothetical protein RBJ76_15595 [Stenomitos frigidus ULC029]